MTLRFVPSVVFLDLQSRANRTGGQRVNTLEKLAMVRIGTTTWMFLRGRIAAKVWTAYHDIELFMFKNVIQCDIDTGGRGGAQLVISVSVVD